MEDSPMKKNQVCLLFASLVLALTCAHIALAQSKDQSKAPAKSAPAAAAKTPELIDLNSATKQQLMTIPCIGDAYAQKIIDNRPYRAKNELVQKKVIPEATYEKMKDLVIAKQSDSSGKAAETKKPAAAKAPQKK